MTVKSPYTAANIAVCDPELTLTVPASVTAATGVDALTHAIEGFTATCAEPMWDAAALYAIELISQNLVKAVENGNDLTARSNMLMGSMLGGISFSHADVASVHCIAESLGSMYGSASRHLQRHLPALRDGIQHGVLQGALRPRGDRHGPYVGDGGGRREKGRGLMLPGLLNSATRRSRCSAR